MLRSSDDPFDPTEVGARVHAPTGAAMCQLHSLLVNSERPFRRSDLDVVDLLALQDGLVARSKRGYVERRIQIRGNEQDARLVGDDRGRRRLVLPPNQEVATRPLTLNVTSRGPDCTACSRTLLVDDSATWSEERSCSSVPHLPSPATADTGPSRVPPLAVLLLAGRAFSLFGLEGDLIDLVGVYGREDSLCSYRALVFSPLLLPLGCTPCGSPRRSRSPIRSRRRVFTAVDADKVDQITLKSEKGKRTTVQKQNGKWQITAPVSAVADEGECRD